MASEDVWTAPEPLHGLEAAQRQMALIYGDANAPVDVRLLRGKDALTFNGSVAELWPSIGRAQADGFQVYFKPNGVGAGFFDRQVLRAGDPATALCADFDDAVPSAWHVPPTFIVARSPTRQQAWWVLQGSVSIESFRELQLQLAYHYGSDTKVSNPATLLRLAGTLNLKEGKSVPYTLVELGGPVAATALRAGLPDALIKKAAVTAAAYDVAEDLPANVARAVALLEREEPLIELAGADDRLYAIAAKVVKDMAISPERAKALILEHLEFRPFDPGRTDVWIASVVDHAAEYGQNGVGAWAVAPLAETYAAVLDNLAADSEGSAEPKPPRFLFLGDDDLEALAEPEWLIKGVIQKHQLGMVKGLPHTAKSAWVFLLACMFGSYRGGLYGIPKEHDPGRVIYACHTGEGLHGLRKKRLPAFHLAHGTKTPGLQTVITPRADDPAGLEEWIEAAKALHPEWVVIDTWRRFLGAYSENDPKESQFGIDALEQIQAGLGHCAITVIHHTSKGSPDVAAGTNKLDASVSHVHLVERKPDIRGRFVKVLHEHHKDADVQDDPDWFEMVDVQGGLLLQTVDLETMQKAEKLRLAEVIAVLNGASSPLTSHQLASSIYRPKEGEGAEQTLEAIKLLAKALDHAAKSEPFASVRTMLAKQPHWLLPTR